MSIGEQRWMVVIRDGKTAHEVTQQKYFFEKLINARIKLWSVIVDKSILSEDDKKLLVKSSTNAREVILYHPTKIEGWIPQHKIEHVSIIISFTFVSKKDFEGFLPWIRLSENLTLYLHNDTNYINIICEWLRVSNFKKVLIVYRGKEFHNIKDLYSEKHENVFNV